MADDICPSTERRERETGTRLIVRIDVGGASDRGGSRCFGESAGWNDGGKDQTPRCIPRDTQDLEPTLTAPSWYVPGVTKPCHDTSEGVVEPMTAYWVFFTTCGGWCDAWRTTPDNADYSAKDCEANYQTCGEKITGYPSDFYYMCHDAKGLSASQVATNIRYWADRARANGTNWRVYTRTESGGYPYTCEFSVVAL